MHMRVVKGFATMSLTKAERKSRVRTLEYDETDMMHCVDILDTDTKVILHMKEGIMVS
jgi:hypothetical protein